MPLLLWKGIIIRTLGRHQIRCAKIHGTTVPPVLETNLASSKYGKKLKMRDVSRGSDSSGGIEAKVARNIISIIIDMIKQGV